MKELSNNPSLLPYLQPAPGSFGLRLEEIESAPIANPSAPFPFKRINTDDPLAHMFPGAFVTDFGSVIRTVNFLIQREIVHPESGLSNAIIDRCWQQALTRRLAGTSASAMVLAAQVNGQQLLAFAPLFYCRKEKKYFEPLCPHCGKVLQLCKDDALLQDAGLVTYADGLHRYLFCPSCSSSGWYTLERKNTDPPMVQDCRQLLLKLADMEGTAVPCPGCRQREDCFGVRQAVHDAVAVISFYPFYLLSVDCDSLEGFGMLNLLADSHIPPVPERDTPKPSAIMEQGQDSVKNEQDLAISAIMQELAGKYQQATPQAVVPPPEDTTFTTTLVTGGDDATDDLSLETVIIGSPGGYQPEEAGTLQTDTVLLSGNVTDSTVTGQPVVPPLPEPPKPPPETKDVSDYDELAETVIIRPGTKP